MVRYREGFRHPIGTGATGLAIEMLQPVGAREREPLQAARRRGYAVSVETLEAGTAAVAAPIATAVHGRLASVGLIYAKSDDRDVPAMGELVTGAACRIGDALAR
jgi:DNA-binding IclR family transcriptional regulator